MTSCINLHRLFQNIVCPSSTRVPIPPRTLDSFMWGSYPVSLRIVLLRKGTWRLEKTPYVLNIVDLKSQLNKQNKPKYNILNNIIPTNVDDTYLCSFSLQDRQISLPWVMQYHELSVSSWVSQTFSFVLWESPIKKTEYAILYGMKIIFYESV